MMRQNPINIPPVSERRVSHQIYFLARARYGLPVNRRSNKDGCKQNGNSHYRKRGYSARFYRKRLPNKEHKATVYQRAQRKRQPVAVYADITRQYERGVQKREKQETKKTYGAQNPFPGFALYETPRNNGRQRDNS
jgi:hypothetical protein